jgi:hypothetical protein
LLNKFKKQTRSWVFSPKKGGGVQKKNAVSSLKTLAEPTLATIYRKFEPAPGPPFDFELPLAGKLAIEA